MADRDLFEPLPAMDVAGRLDRAVGSVGQLDCATLLVTDLVNVGYLTGFSGSAGELLLTDDRVLLLTDGRYGEQVERQLAAAGVSDRVDVCIGGVGEQREALAAAVGARSIGIEGEHLTVSARDDLDALVEGAVVTTSGVVAALRECKDPGEVARMERAAAIADQALADVLEQLVVGVTEIDFARTLERRMFDLGAEGLSFDTICAAGPNGALPHARPSDRRVESGDLVVLDFGAVIDGYHSDMTRTFSVGAPSDATAEMLAVVTEAQARGAGMVAPGVGCDEVDNACRSCIEDAGLGEWFIHGTGHGVGRVIHEAPWVNARNPVPLMTGQVVTVEPGVYRPGIGGVRVEDSLLVTETGARALTLHPKDPVLAR